MVNTVTNFEMPNGENVMIKDILNKEYPTNTTRTLKGGTALFCGDSYTYGTGASDHLAGDTKRFSSLICAALEMEEINVAVGSTGFIDPGSGGQNAPFQTQLQNWYNANQDKAGDIDAVFISGGYNDVFYEAATFSATVTAAKNIIKYAAETFPNAFIVFTPMLWRGFNFIVKGKNLYTALVQGCMGAEHNERVIMMRDAWSWTFYESACASDHIHPNDTGHAAIAAAILQGLNGQGNDYVSWEQIKKSSGTTFTNTPFCLIKGMMCHLDPFQVSFSEIDAGSSAVIGTAPNVICPVDNVYTPIFKKNVQVGNWALTPSGNFYIFNTSDAALTDCYCAPASWQLYGKEY